MWTPLVTRDFSLSNSGRRVKRFRVSDLLMRRVDDCRSPAWRCADRVYIELARFNALQSPLVVGSTHKIPFDACWIRSGDCDSIKRIEKPLLKFFELYNGREAKP